MRAHEVDIRTLEYPQPTNLLGFLFPLSSSPISRDLGFHCITHSLPYITDAPHFFHAHSLLSLLSPSSSGLGLAPSDT